jgi:hypothetical protein
MYTNALYEFVNYVFARFPFDLSVRYFTQCPVYERGVFCRDNISVILVVEGRVNEDGGGVRYSYSDPVFW